MSSTLLTFFTPGRDERQSPRSLTLSSVRGVEGQLSVKVNDYFLKSTQRKSTGHFLQRVI